MGEVLSRHGMLCGQTARREHVPLEEYADWLLTLVSKQPDLTLDEVVLVMHKHGIPGSRTAVWRFFQRHKITFKKKPARGGAGTPGRRPGAPALETRADHA